jgi:hypothetical protein
VIVAPWIVEHATAARMGVFGPKLLELRSSRQQATCRAGFGRTHPERERMRVLMRVVGLIRLFCGPQFQSPEFPNRAIRFIVPFPAGVLPASSAACSPPRCRAFSASRSWSRTARHRQADRHCVRRKVGAGQLRRDRSLSGLAMSVTCATTCRLIR